MAVPIETLSIFAQRLDAAAQTVTPIPMLSLEQTLTPAEGYAIQRELITLREARGDRVVGHKAGLTSRAKMKQVGVDEPLRGVLTAQLALEDGGALSRAAHIHPRVEPELAFILSRDLSGPVSPVEAMGAVGAVCVALEVLDSRYKDFTFTLPDVVADNTSAARFVLGSERFSPEALPPLDNLGVVLSKNGAPVQIASTAAVLGHPARALAALANMLHAAGSAGLSEGDIILTGGITAAVPMSAGDHFELEIEAAGRVSVSVTD